MGVQKEPPVAFSVVLVGMLGWTCRVGYNKIEDTDDSRTYSHTHGRPFVGKGPLSVETLPDLVLNFTGGRPTDEVVIITTVVNTVDGRKEPLRNIRTDGGTTPNCT